MRSGACGATNSAPGTAGAHICARSIRSSPSAPRPCTSTTSASGAPPRAGPKRGPSSSTMRCSPLRCRRPCPLPGATHGRNRHRHPLRAEPDRVAAPRPCAFGRLRPGAAAREAGGRFLLRIEDIDPARCRPDFTEAILRGPGLARPRLGWRGARPVAAPGRLPRGARRAGRARAALSVLLHARATSRARSPPAPPRRTGRTGALYPGTCRRLSRRRTARRASHAGEPHALRLDMARGAGARCAAPLTLRRSTASAAALRPRALRRRRCWRARTSRPPTTCA